MTRRSTLSGQGSSLLTFAGVIQTIIVAPLVAFATNPQAKALLLSNAYISYIKVLFGVGFAAYILTVALAIMSFRETLWVPAPQLISSADENQWRQELDSYNNLTNPKKFEYALHEMQLMEAITTHQLTNKRKYNFLSAGYVALFVGVALTVIAGYLLLLGST